MIKWNYIEAADTVAVGITENGDPYKELEIVGYDEFNNHSRMETIASVRGISRSNNIDFTIQFRFDKEQLEEIIFVRIEEAKQDILEMFEEE